MPRTPRRRQAGISMLGLLFWAIVIGFFGYIAVQVVPTVSEFASIQRMVDKVAAGQPNTVGEARTAYDKLQQVEYTVKAISSGDLDITKEGDKVVIKFAYEKRVPLFGPASLLINYEGKSH